jgi:AraC-like DNA-binding protein
MKTLSDGGYAISDRIKIDGEGASVFVFGRGWLLEIVDLATGDYCFISNGETVHPCGRHFGVYYPAFSLVRPFVRNVAGTVDGVGSVRSIAGLPGEAVVFDTEFEGEFTEVDQAVKVLAAARNVQGIDVNTRPSLISIRCKKLIDANYVAFPSISRIAGRLKVSHEHMSRQFKRDYGIAPSAYLHHLRVAEATFRLSMGEEIVDISGDVGYNDLSRFYKQFRKTTATSPGECRVMLAKH